MSATENKAVFLSYASQDAEAAKKISDALSAAGVEVWFDRSELRGGDTWDQKIRKQIKECTLFLPVVSANTQARREGYFRLEWKLADDRTHLMARGTPFLVPVCIDETKDWDALVPDSFMNVQWTRLPGGETSAKFAERVVQLLAGEVAPVSDRRSEAGATPNAGQRPALPQAEKNRRIPAAAAALTVAVALAIGAGLFFATRPKPAASSPTASIASTPSPAAAATTRDWPRDPELKRAITLVDGLEATLEDFRLADEISARAIEKAPADPDTVTVRARVHSAFVMRNFDFSAERAVQAKRFGERAMQLAPDSPQALYALAVFLHDRAKDYAQAEALARRACALAPDEPRFWRQVARSVARQRPAEGLALGEELVRRFPRDVLVHYEVSILYRDQRMWDKFERENDAAIALFPLANAVNWKARAAGLLHGDFAEMRRWLDRVPARVRAEERTVVTSLFYATLGGDYEFGLKSLQGFAEPWFFDAANYAGPSALPQAMLLALQGKSGLARAQYEQALAELLRYRKENPSDQTSRRAEIWILLGLGRLEEARAQYRTGMEGLARPARVFAMTGWWFEFIPLGLLLGERDTALQLMREAASVPEGRATIRHRMSVDARMAPFRDDPDIVALLAEPKTETSAAPAAKADDKSVAVLAFANLSDDKDNEYFSDGISEELLNVLAKIPGLKVSARTSAFSFKGKNVPIPEIAQKLGVAFVMDGSVRKAGNRVRITAQLIKAADGFQVWSETYDRELKDIFAVQDEIAKAILDAVKISLLGGVEQPRAIPTKIEAYTLFLQGQGELAKRGDAHLRSAVRLFDAALAIDRDYLPAWVGQALACVLLPNYANLSGPAAQEFVDRAKQSAHRALALDPRNAEAYAVLGRAHAMMEWHWSEGEAELLHARELAPNNGWVANFIGDYDSAVRNDAAAIAAKKLAWNLGPLDANNHWDLSYAYFDAGDYEQAIHWGELAVGLAPQNIEGYVPLVLAAGKAGRPDLLRRTLVAARKNVPDDEGWLLQLEAHGAIFEKRPAEARRLLALAEPLVKAGTALPAYTGFLHLLLGDSADAMVLLRRGYDVHDFSLVSPECVDLDLVAADPITRPILDLPGVKEIYELRVRNVRLGKQ